MRVSVFLPVHGEIHSIDGTGGDETVLEGVETILVADDAAITILMKAFLESFGYTVVAHTDPVRAWDEFRRDANRFDLVLTDQTMPRMTGTDLTREVRRLRPEIPVVLCSGLGSGGAEGDAKKRAFGNFLREAGQQEESRAGRAPGSRSGVGSGGWVTWLEYSLSKTISRCG